jgi:hypothetical protein
VLTDTALSLLVVCLENQVIASVQLFQCATVCNCQSRVVLVMVLGSLHPPGALLVSTLKKHSHCVVQDPGGLWHGSGAAFHAIE